LAVRLASDLIAELAGHDLWLALYAKRPGEQYGVGDEIAGRGYVAGGMRLAGATVVVAGRRAGVAFAAATWPQDSRFDVRYGLIYDRSVADWPARAVLDFGETKSPRNDPFVVTFPEPVIGVEVR